MESHFEREFFGFTAEEIWRTQTFPERLPYNDAFQLTKANQHSSWNPRSPSTTLSQKLFDKVKEKLIEKSRRSLNLYCCLGLPMDYHHTDGFFQIEKRYNPLNRNLIARFDLKGRGSRKTGTYGTVIIIKPQDLHDENIEIIVAAIISRLVRTGA